MTPRADALAILLRNRRKVDAERRAFAEAAVDAIQAAQRDQSAPFGTMAYMRASIALRPIFDEFYGRYPGDLNARFPRLILEQSRAARGLALRRATADVRRRLKAHPDLLRAIREAA